MSVIQYRPAFLPTRSASSIRRADTDRPRPCTHSGVEGAPDSIRFCSRCGTRAEIQVPQGDHLPRHVCPACCSVLYQNPRIIVGILTEAGDGRVVMCRRAIAPKQGFWTFPAGYLENGETGEEGAKREAREETGVLAETLGLYMVMNVLAVREVHLIYRGNLLAPDFAPGLESTEVRIVGEDSMPWEELAHPAIGTCLRRYFSDRADGHFPVRSIDVVDEGVLQQGRAAGVVEPDSSPMKFRNDVAC